MENPFKWRHYEAEIILTCARWYLRYALSYRDLAEMMIERGLWVVHTTLFRWVQEYAPDIDKRSRPHLKKSHDSWRVDERLWVAMEQFCPPGTILCLEFGRSDYQRPAISEESGCNHDFLQILERNGHSCSDATQRPISLLSSSLRPQTSFTPVTFSFE